MSAASPVTTGNALGKPRLTAGVFLLGEPTTTCCGFVNQVSARGAQDAARLLTIRTFIVSLPPQHHRGGLRPLRNPIRL